MQKKIIDSFEKFNIPAQICLLMICLAFCETKPLAWSITVLAVVAALWLIYLLTAAWKNPSVIVLAFYTLWGLSCLLLLLYLLNERRLSFVNLAFGWWFSDDPNAIVPFLVFLGISVLCSGIVTVCNLIAIKKGKLDSEL